MRLQNLYVLKSKKVPILNEILNSKIDEYFEKTEEAKCPKLKN